MPTHRLRERGAGSPKVIVERDVLTDDSGAVRFIRTNPSDGDAVLEDRPATTDEQERFDSEIEAIDRFSVMATALDKPDADITSAKLKTVTLKALRYLHRRWLDGNL